jgi:hypothetical protein
MGVRPPRLACGRWFFDRPTCGRQVAEQMLIEASVSEAAVQALDAAVPHRLAGCAVNSTASILPWHSRFSSGLSTATLPKLRTFRRIVATIPLIAKYCRAFLSISNGIFISLHRVGIRLPNGRPLSALVRVIDGSGLRQRLRAGARRYFLEKFNVGSLCCAVEPAPCQTVRAVGKD